MRKMAILVILACSFACRVNRISRDGPTPELTAVVRTDVGSSPNPVLCSPQGGSLRIEGTGISPMPRKMLTDEATVELPTVDLVSATVTLRLVGGTWAPATGALTVVVPPNTPWGVYNLTVTNPNGNTDTLNNAVEITETCRELELCSSVDPAFGWVNGRTRIEICATTLKAMDCCPCPRCSWPSTRTRWCP